MDAFESSLPLSAVSFIRAVGLDELSFESIANDLGRAPFIADIVTTGIGKADAVIALFTPDEQAVLYDPTSGRSLGNEAGGSRWQARPNVIFEAGVAYGRSGKEPILAVLGADVTLFSDVAGVHFIQLDSPRAKRDLFDRLAAAVGRLKVRMPDWETSAGAGDFLKCASRRWKFFHEVEEIEHYLANRHVGSKGRIPLLEIVTSVVLADEERDWSKVDARAFMEAVRARYSEARTDLAYWWLIVYGFFQFDNIEYWGTTKDATWDDSVDEARLVPRGVALIDRLRAAGGGRCPNKALPTSPRRAQSRRGGGARAPRG